MKFVELWMGIDDNDKKEKFCEILVKNIPGLIGAIPHERKDTLIMLYFKEKGYRFESFHIKIPALCKTNDVYFISVGETRKHYP